MNATLTALNLWSCTLMNGYLDPAKGFMWQLRVLQSEIAVLLHMAGPCTLQLLLTAFEGSFMCWGSCSKAWSPAATEVAHQDLSCTAKSSFGLMLLVANFLGIGGV